MKFNGLIESRFYLMYSRAIDVIILSLIYFFVSIYSYNILSYLIMLLTMYYFCSSFRGGGYSEYIQTFKFLMRNFLPLITINIVYFLLYLSLNYFWAKSPNLTIVSISNAFFLLMNIYSIMFAYVYVSCGQSIYQKVKLSFILLFGSLYNLISIVAVQLLVSIALLNLGFLSVITTSTIYAICAYLLIKKNDEYIEGWNNHENN